MKNISKIISVCLILVGVFSFSKTEETFPKLELSEFNMIKKVLNEKKECRPSSEFMFYVETELIKKYRGYNKVKANIYVLNRDSGLSSLLASKNVAIPNYKGSVLIFDHQTNKTKNVELLNGDKIIGKHVTEQYNFNELMKNKIIYSSYVRSANKLLLQNRKV